MKALQIEEKDLEERFIKGSGPGGQKINKSNTCVFLKHVRSNLEIKCQKTRSLQDNRLFARRKLCERYKTEILGEEDQTLKKIKKQKKRRQRRRNKPQNQNI